MEAIATPPPSSLESTSSHHEQAKILLFKPRSEKDNGTIDTEETVVVKKWILDALILKHKQIGEFLDLLQMTSSGGIK